MEVPALAASRMKVLLRLYPRSWRKRYGREMEVLLDDVPGQIGVALDLILGAGSAYATVIRGNRILNAGGAFLHGVCVAVLLQAIAFVSFVLVGFSASPSAYVTIGPVHLANFERSPFLYHGGILLLPAFSVSPLAWLPAAAVLVVLIGALALVLVAPRLIRRSAG